MTRTVEIENLTKHYGNQPALQEVSFAVLEGTCFGLLGPNGAGKSTTMKIITGIIEGDGGSARVFGLDLLKNRDSVRRRIGYVPQEITLYDKISAYNNLVFFGELYGVRGRELSKRIGEVLAQVGLSDRAKDPVKTFSGGMKRRINMAGALLHKPSLLILDEPTVGIDPQSRNHIFGMIRQLQAEGVTIIYSTHYMEEVESLCDDIAIIDHGRVLIQGSLELLLEQYGTRAIFLEAEGFQELPELPFASKVYGKNRGWLIETESLLETMQTIVAAALEKSIKVKNLRFEHPSLETVFLNLTGTHLRD